MENKYHWSNVCSGDIKWIWKYFDEQPTPYKIGGHHGSTGCHGTGGVGEQTGTPITRVEFECTNLYTNEIETIKVDSSLTNYNFYDSEEECVVHCYNMIMALAENGHILNAYNRKLFPYVQAKMRMLNLNKILE